MTGARWLFAPPGEGEGSRAARTLALAAALYGVTIAIHTADHVRRGLGSVTPEVLRAGSVSTVIAAGAIVLALMRNRFAPAVAAAVGFSSALGVAAVHLLPQWSAFSDPFPGSSVDIGSWIAVCIEILGAVAFGLAGLSALLRQRNPTLGSGFEP